MTIEVTTAKTPLKFVIVGAGLGGLTAAIGLKLSGHSVTVLEQAPALGEVGAGIQIPPNSTKILETFGCKDKLLKASTLPRACRFFKWDSGVKLSQQDLYPYCVEKYGGEYLHIHRADFHRILVERAQELEVEVILNAKVTDIDFEKETLTCGDGRTFSGDVIIGADGIRSIIRSALLGRDDPPHETGDLAYRALVKCSELRNDPELAFIHETPNISFWWGPNIHVVVYLLHGGETCNIVVLSPDTLPEGANVGPALPGELAELFRGWDPRLQKLISLVESTGKWKLQNSREMDSWVHKSGNIALMGDACHATLPYLAQGAAQAVEDGACLTEMFSKLDDKSQIHHTLKVYEQLRKSRTTRIVQESTNCQNIYHLPDGPRQLERDRLCSLNPPEEGCPNRWADPVFQKYMFGYDVAREVKVGFNVKSTPIV